MSVPREGLGIGGSEMRTALGVAGALAFACLCAFAFVQDQMENSIGDLGPQLVKVVGVAGEVQSEIARPSADDLIKNRSLIQRRLGDLKEATEAIFQLLVRMNDKPELTLKNLDEVKRTEFLRSIPAELRSDVEKNNAVSMKVVLQIYMTIKTDVQRDMSSFGGALSEIRGSSNQGLVNNVGLTRAALTANLGRLVEFSGRIQELAYSQRA
jgi:hypothetical protein